MNMGFYYSDTVSAIAFMVGCVALVAMAFIKAKRKD